MTREVEMLEDASSACVRPISGPPTSHELTTRLREGQESSQRKGLFRRAPPTPLSTWRRSRRIALPPASTFTRSL
ncbi:MAG: hypothetical protein ACLTYN_05720 [Dysosmobacter welbionis]